MSIVANTNAIVINSSRGRTRPTLRHRSQCRDQDAPVDTMELNSQLPTQVMKESVRSIANDSRVARRRYPDCVARWGRPRVRPLEDCLTLPQRSPLHTELESALAAASRLHMIKSDLVHVPVRVTSTISEAGAYRYRRANPIDLRVSNRSGHRATGFLHELGHFVDHQVHYDRKSRVWASAVHPAFAGWRAVAAKLNGRPFPGGSYRRRYFESAQEGWPRCYAQTWLMRSGDRLLLCLARDGEHRVTECVQRFLRLGLRRLDHQRLGDDQREVDRRRMEAVVHQALRDVEGRDPVLALERARAEHELMHAKPVERQAVRILEPCKDVVGV